MTPRHLQILISLTLALVLLVPAANGAQAHADTDEDGSARIRATEATSGEAVDARAVGIGLAVGKRTPFRVNRGAGELALFIPQDEELIFEVNVAWGILGAALGTVTMSAGVEPFREALLVPSKKPGIKAGKTGWMKAHAYGEHLFYTLDATLETRHQPTDWPSIVYRSSQGGSENRRRELLLGVLDGKPQSSYRRDTDKGAPRGTRIWKDPVLREIPPAALDMTSAVYLVRSFIAQGLDQISFPVLDKKELWDMHLSRGSRARQDTPAGSFDAIEVILIAGRYPGEVSGKKKKFEGLFGLHGGIHLWVDHATGVPVRVQGEIPAGPITLSVDISLVSFRGTPTAMRTLPAVRD